MQIRNSSQHYGAVAMALHWLVLALIVVSWLTGEFSDAFPKGPPRDAAIFAHVTLGLSIIAFAVARLCWRFADPPPAPEESTLGQWTEWASQAVHYIIYALLFAIPALGIVALFARGKALSIFGLFEIASPWVADRTFAHNMGEVHEVLVNVLLILVVLHAAAALVHHYILKDRTLLRMLPESRA
ncbi:MAG: cytochrome b [Bradyrhizobium sp.]|uniref:cytochrome b n=1 Tax=Bradyrhizobium sp. TaxID=376 RepID=UPI0025BD8B43|nr:cytochrome b [Bradyrhizobium sp.]MBI5264241.1 cytochrome b [Bradyrhizobium sp.]